MILAIETSTPQGGIALWDTAAGAIRHEESFVSDRAHNAKIFAPLERTLQGFDGPPQLIVIGTGPGSYSGVRVGISIANALSLAYHVPVIGLPSWSGLPVKEPDYVVVGDARRKSYFLGRVRGRFLQATPEVLDPEPFAEEVRRCLAEGLRIYSTDEAPPLDLEGISLAKPRAAELVQVAAELSAEKVAELAALPIEPFYLREAYITLPTRRSTTVQDS